MKNIIILIAMLLVASSSFAVETCRPVADGVYASTDLIEMGRYIKSFKTGDVELMMAVTSSPTTGTTSATTEMTVNWRKSVDLASGKEEIVSANLRGSGLTVFMWSPTLVCTKN